MTQTRRALLVLNPGRPEARATAQLVVTALLGHDFQVRIAQDDFAAWGQQAPEGLAVVPADEHAADDTEVVVVLGGDGTILRAAERARRSSVPLLTVNLGHVGFLAEAESEDIEAVVEAILHRRWRVEERMALDVRVFDGAQMLLRTWALNEISIEKAAGARMIEVLVTIDGRPLSRWGCDGIVAATPTGSTAYAFSGGGPVVWPDVEAMLLVPLSAHALFARPLVVGPSSVICLELSEWSDAWLAADSRRTFELRARQHIEVRRDPSPVLLARLVDAPFTDRLVAKFALPVDGWRKS